MGDLPFEEKRLSDEGSTPSASTKSKRNCETRAKGGLARMATRDETAQQAIERMKRAAALREHLPPIKERCDTGHPEMREAFLSTGRIPTQPCEVCGLPFNWKLDVERKDESEFVIRRRFRGTVQWSWEMRDSDGRPVASSVNSLPFDTLEECRASLERFLKRARASAVPVRIDD